MLEVLANTALERHWSPALFSRLYGQLQDSVELDKGAGFFLVKRHESSSTNVLLLEYIMLLALDARSVLPMDELFNYWAGQQWKDRSQQSQNLIIYIARGLDKWTVPTDKASVLTSALTKLLDQAIEGSAESLFLINCFVLKGPYETLAGLDRDWSSSFESKIETAAQQAKATEKKLLTEIFKHFSLHKIDRPSADSSSKPYSPSRTFRLLWLDAAVNSVVYLESQILLDQIDLLWPNERMLTLIYELSLTAFDGYASALLNCKKTVPLWEAFIVKKLPLVLEGLKNASGEEEQVDSAMVRLITTMDKELISVVDGAGTLRSDFGKACVDLGICDAAVLHTLHQDYKPQPEKTDTVFDVPIDQMRITFLSQDPEKVRCNESLVFKVVHNFTTFGPRTQNLVAKELLEFVLQPTSTPLRHYARLCQFFCSNPSAADHLFFHIPLRQFIGALVKHVDVTAAAEVPNTTIYADVTSVLSLIYLVCKRYALGKVFFGNERSWTLNYVMQSGSDFFEISDLTEAQSELLGAWLVGLLGSRGVGDEICKPPIELLTIFPVIIKQLIIAYENAMISFDTLKGGLDYLVQPFLLPTLPIALKVFEFNLWERRNVAVSLEILKQLLTSLQAKSNMPEFSMVVTTIRPQLELIAKFAVDVTTDKDVHNLAIKLASQGKQWMVTPSPFSGSLKDAVKTNAEKMCRWQEKPTGVPLIDKSVIMLAQESFGPGVTRKLIESVSANTAASKEVVIAFLVVYGSGLFTNSRYRPQMIDADGKSLFTDISHGYIDKLRAIIDASNAREREVSIAASPTKAKEAVFVAADKEDNPEPVSLDTSFEPSNFGNGPDIDMDMDMDLGIPMDMDELDNAINFDMWE